MEVRAKKALGQHFLTDQGIAMTIVDSLEAGGVRNVLEIGPGMGVLTQYLLKRDDIDLKLVELDGESVEYLLTHFPGMQGKLYEMDYLKLDVHLLFPGEYRVIGNFPYNISSQIFFKILEDKDRVTEVVCMIQKEVADRIAEKLGGEYQNAGVDTETHQHQQVVDLRGHRYGAHTAHMTDHHGVQKGRALVQRLLQADGQRQTQRFFVKGRCGKIRSDDPAFHSITLCKRSRRTGQTMAPP